MASLRVGPVAGRAWWSGLMSERKSDLELDRVRREGFALWSAQRPRQRERMLPAVLGLLGELPSGPELVQYFDGVATLTV
jgi:hypothetical protein